MGYSVVLAEVELGNDLVKPVADAVARVTGALPIDALGRVKRARGVLADNLDRPAASGLVDDVLKLGVKAGMAQRPETGRRWPVASGGCSKRGLHADPGRQGMRVYPWPSVRVMSLVRYREQQVVTRAVGGAHFGAIGFAGVGALQINDMARARASMLQSTETVDGAETYLLELFLRDPLVTLRIDARQFHYGYLGDKMGDRFEINFHMLVSHLVQGAESAVRAPTVDRYLGGDLLSGSTITDPKEFDVYNRWLLLAADAFADSR